MLPDSQQLRDSSNYLFQISYTLLIFNFSVADKSLPNIIKMTGISESFNVLDLN